MIGATDTIMIGATDTIIIGATDTMDLLEEVCKHFPYPEDGKVQDSSNNTPYHLVMGRKKSPSTIRICEILSHHPINPNVPNNHGKKPGEGRTKDHQEKKDRRYHIMQEAARQFHTTKKKSGAKRKRNQSFSASTPTESNSSPVLPNSPASKAQNIRDPSKPPAENTVLDIDNVNDEINEMVKLLSEKPTKYFNPPPGYMRQRSKPHDDPTPHQAQGAEETPLKKAAKTTTTTAIEQTPSKVEIDLDDINCNFDDAAWEIECTDKVKKFFTNSKVPRKEKEKVIKTLMKLVNGIPKNNPKLCKEVRSAAKLFESHYTKASRIIFEIAIQFSPRLTDQSGYIYSEVIRVWDIVRDHDNLDRSIAHAHECIKKSQNRGKEAAIKTPLKISNGAKPKHGTQGQENLRIPQCYACDVPKGAQGYESTLMFTPAGSTKDDEYNVITFYSFDSHFVKSMLDGDNARRDFPFKEWPKEHDIISMPQGKVSILLLGRSGTGKTTCCLYRLWNQFQAYWMLVKSFHSEPCMPQKQLAILHHPENIDFNDSDHESGESLSNEDSDQASDDESQPATQSLPTPMQHFHQVFITKNYVLCAQMKKRFYDMAAGSDIAESHMAYEDAEIPTSISEINDHAFPLFLTARQFFILLDNSLHDGNAFFPRDGEGKLKEKIVSSDYDHEDPDTLLDLEESDSEGEGDQDTDFDDEDFVMSQPASEKRKLPLRREITASYFADKIWPKIGSNVSLRDTKIDPLLVWMEIKSFIKGSMHAIEKEEGYLSEEEYVSLGKKMAPNYVDKRSDIYKIFKLYLNYVGHHSKESVFDECDLNRDIYKRLAYLTDLPWSIHNIYVDEVQDFTQAELSILIRICREPNDLFLTGDTAQSIMRGIAFRFGDLKSIFYRASKQASKSVKSAPVRVPKVNELTINFRSHTGVLRLAASVIDLMKHFFPNSFDCLPGDEGMFPGPTPIVLDSCNVSDLALVLRTNKREASTIEFGAHQVIIVQSEEAKKNIPDVLKAGIVLTVFEAKGLEFDDVLLYNFFKYSKVSKFDIRW